MAQRIVSVLEIYDLQTSQRTVVREFDDHIEAPNWLADGRTLLFNADGRLYTYDLETGMRSEVNTGFCTRCNNDHVPSPKGDAVAVSHHIPEDGQSRIYVIPLDTGKPRLITPMGPSYLHGWSPDGSTLAYCAERNGDYDVYTIAVEGGVETRLTDAVGLDDGCEYSPCGRHIWFNSVRSGLMQVWRMNADGSEQTRMTFEEELNCWFPHVSPDGQKVVYIAYKKGDVEPGDHPANKNVQLRLMSAEGGESRVLAEVFGGQGTINVNSWSPDSTKFAFVSYRME